MKTEEITVYNAKTDKELLFALEESNNNSTLCKVAFKKFKKENSIIVVLSRNNYEKILCAKAIPYIRNIEIALRILKKSQNNSCVRKAVAENAKRMIMNKK